MCALPRQPVYFPFAEAQKQLKMGLKPLLPEEWIAIDDEFTFYLACKAELLQQQMPAVLGGLPGSEPAQQEILFLLIDYLVTYLPQYYDRQGDCITCLLTQQTWNITEFSHHPLLLAAQLIQEDFCLLQSMSSEYILTAGCVCFPFHWSFPDKLGKPLAQIHQPVPGYAERLENPVNAMFDRLRVEHPVCRFNWGIVDSPDLHLATHARSIAANLPFTIQNIAQQLWLRVERQTLRRLPQTQAVLFTIRTYRYPLTVLEKQPTVAQALSIAIQQMPILMQQYKNLPYLQNILLEYLAWVADDQQ